jgi:hypothetical protein
LTKNHLELSVRMMDSLAGRTIAIEMDSAFIRIPAILGLFVVPALEVEVPARKGQ